MELDFLIKVRVRADLISMNGNKFNTSKISSNFSKVFHICALTDDGLIMKSFLCPESTLFDQTILKCNWWFYVDCKSSKNLYDSNIPISKSYQLMKALAFFSAYKSNDNSSTVPAQDAPQS